MLKKDLAAALGVSGSMVSRLARQGMPVDSVGAAKRWRDAHLETARRKEYRAHSMPAPRARRAADDGAERAAGQARVALAHLQALGHAGARLLAEGASIAAIEPALRQALRLVPIPYRDQVRLVGSPEDFVRILGRPASAEEPATPPDSVDFPLAVWDRLVAGVLGVVRAAEAEMITAGELQRHEERPPLSDDDAAWMADFWYCVAAGEVGLPE